MGEFRKAIERMKEDSLREAEKIKDEKYKLDYENPYLRAKIGELEAEIQNLKLDNAKLTESLYECYKRIQALADAQIEVLDREKIMSTISGDEKTW